MYSALHTCHHTSREMSRRAVEPAVVQIEAPEIVRYGSVGNYSRGYRHHLAALFLVSCQSAFGIGSPVAVVRRIGRVGGFLRRGVGLGVVPLVLVKQVVSEVAAQDAALFGGGIDAVAVDVAVADVAAEHIAVGDIHVACVELDDAECRAEICILSVGKDMVDSLLSADALVLDVGVVGDVLPGGHDVKTRVAVCDDEHTCRRHPLDVCDVGVVKTGGAVVCGERRVGGVVRIEGGGREDVDVLTCRLYLLYRAVRREDPPCADGQRQRTADDSLQQE